MTNACYAAFQAAVTWQDAEAACVAWGGHLVSIHSEEELNFVHSLTPTNTWIGYRNGQATWTDGSAFDYSNWNGGEPNGPAGFCAQMYVRLTWNDLECDSILNPGNGFRNDSYVCKKPYAEPVPEEFPAPRYVTFEAEGPGMIHDTGHAAEGGWAASANEANGRVLVATPPIPLGFLRVIVRTRANGNPADARPVMSINVDNSQLGHLLDDHIFVAPNAWSRPNETRDFTFLVDNSALVGTTSVRVAYQGFNSLFIDKIVIDTQPE